MSGFLDWLFGKGSKEVKPDPASSHTLSETSSHTITKASFRMQLSSYYTDRFDELIRAASSGDRHALPSVYATEPLFLILWIGAKPIRRY